MMEPKLWVALCALLVFNMGSTGNVDESQSVAPALSVNDPSLNTTSGAQNASNTNSTIGLSSNSTKENETISAPKPGNNNGTNGTDQLTPQAKNHSSTYHPTPPSAVTSSTNLTYTSAPPASNHSNISDHSAFTPSNQSAQTETFSPTTVPQTRPPTTVAGTRPSSASSASSSTEPPSTHRPADTSHASAHPGTSSEAQPTSAATPLNSTSTRVKIHPASPSQLNVEGDTAVAHASPTLDPLLAGLVSAFIVTAIIITLLLFLKLRRRDSRPEFRRLQELPMDDMEDTPLSMYSY
ncbi:mucin-21 [Kryptolebias marmoratus]|uniref:Mucin-21-like n=1 Tax=Kryptolebias marmoratus TaxID=37003 RepID=A0A3Q3AH14_KRYMA|nr:mucin-21 [Kryptolebias marmoratus]